MIDRDFVLRGPAAEFYLYEGLEALLEGGTRCGKSFAFLIKAKDVADRYPQSRQLIVRQTRKSLNESILRDWREEILWLGHQAISPTASREHQDLYRWPNGAEVFFAGMENARDTTNPILSTKWDRIYWCQLEESQSPSDWELLATRLNNGKTPYYQLVGDVNPAAPGHWVNQRFGPDKVGPARKRFLFRHYDNPRFYKGLHPKGSWTKEGAEYMAILEGTLTGVRRERFLYSRWVAAEGVILENWDPRIHSIDAKLTGSLDEGFFIVPKGHSIQFLGDQPIRIAYFTAGVDFGWKPDPGCMQLWAYDSPRWHPLVRRFRVAEVMKLEWQKDQWAELAEQWWQTYDVRYFSCDPSDPENINNLNIRLGKKGYRSAPKVAIKCPPIGGGHQRAKHHTAAIDLMREGLKSAKGHTRSYFLKDAFPEGVDEELRRTGRSTCFEQEVESWVYEVNPQGQPTTKPSRASASHANAIFCLAPDTLILTADGEVPIQDVMIGDLVLVPYEDEVVAIWRSKEPKDLLRLELPWGELVGTSNHRLWTLNGWKKLGEIEGESLLCWAQNPSSTTDFSGIATRIQRPPRRGSTFLAQSGADAFSSIATSGKKSAVLVGGGCTSITSTATPETTELRTSRKSRQRSTRPIIRCRRWEDVLEVPGCEVQGSRRAVLLEAERGGRVARLDEELAVFARDATGLAQVTHGRACAPTSVASSIGGTRIPTTITAGAPRPAGRARVYNLTVRTTSRYIAGGVMVANSAMYDETLNFVRGFGREQAFFEKPPPDTVAAILYDEEQDRKKAQRLARGRKAPWQ